MSQIFTPVTNIIARLSLFIGLLLLVIVISILLLGNRSPYTNATVGIAVEQPVRFSHQLHSGDLNISCAYCHGAAEEGPYGGIPDTHTCMSCHSQVALHSELLEPVRQSYATGEPLEWNPVHDLADHVYFNHSAHVNNGVACESCHGNVEEMPLVWREAAMTMQWCLDCHWDPEEFLRPADEVYTFGYEQPENQIELGLQLIDEYDIDVERLANCNACHR